MYEKMKINMFLIGFIMTNNVNMIMIQMLDQCVLRVSRATSAAGAKQILWIQIGLSRPCSGIWRD